MRRDSAGRKVWVMAMAGVVGLTFAVLGRAQDSEKTTNSPKASPSRADAKDRASGVILKVEKVTKGADGGSPVAKETAANPARRPTLRLTINTDAVWRDWAQDQYQKSDTSPSKDAAKGKNSVATKGEPVESNNVVVVDIVPDTKVETRFRALDDETSKGDRKPESGKAVEFKADDLKPGLFVEADFKHVTAQNLAKSVAVIRPTSSSKK